MVKYIDKDIIRLANVMKLSRKSGAPFSLLTGAGCSKSADIPLANELVQEIHNDFKEEIRHKLPKEKHRDYGANMSCLSPAERKNLLSPYLSNKTINWAHIAIAALIKEKYINRVLTFNFDSILSRACGLLGIYPATYDFAAAHSVDTSYIAEQAIIHLHGQGHGMIMLNSDEETASHAENLRPLFRSILSETPLLVIGYSGTSDSVFPILKSEFNGKQRLYWAQYEETPHKDIEDFIKQGGKTSEIIYGTDADLFLIELAQALKCFPLESLSNPYSYLLERLEPVCNFPISTEEKSDLLSDLRNKLKSGQTKFENDSHEKPDLQKMMMNSDWKEVIRLARPENDQDRELLARAYLMQGNALSKDAENQKEHEAEILWQEACNNYDNALKNKPDYYIALFNWGNTLTRIAKQKKETEAESLHQQACEKYASTLRIKGDYYQALNNWGYVLTKLAQTKKGAEADILWKQANEKFADAFSINPSIYKSLNNWGDSLVQQSLLPENRNKSAELLTLATEKYLRCNQLKPGSGAYGLACMDSLQGKLSSSLQWLEEARIHNELDAEHMLKDSDLKALHATDEFSAWKAKHFPNL